MCYEKKNFAACPQIHTHVLTVKQRSSSLLQAINGIADSNSLELTIDSPSPYRTLVIKQKNQYHKTTIINECTSDFVHNAHSVTQIYCNKKNRLKYTIHPNNACIMNKEFTLQ
jgi:uncharacterized membrane protein